MNRRYSALLATALLAACGGEPPAVEVESPVAYAPLASGRPGSAYFTLRNPRDEALTVVGIRCPLFGRAELHETVVVDGMYRMRRVAELAVPARGEVALVPGGLHVMLMEPADGTAPGSRCPMTIDFADGSSVTFEVLLETRTPEAANSSTGEEARP